MPIVAFHMGNPVRQNLIAAHRFYVEQARKRLLSQFENLDDEVNETAEMLLNEIEYDPQIVDPYDVYEAVREKSIELCQMLSDLQDRTRLSVIAGMYHEWDKKLREWMTREMRHWHNADLLKRAVWDADMPDLLELLTSFDWDVAALECHDRLDVMRLVVNVFKHGKGTSLERLKLQRPEFFPSIGAIQGGLPSHLIDHTQMMVKDRHVEEFSEAIVAFWEAVPESIIAKDEVEVPRRFEKAFNKDRSATS